MGDLIILSQSPRLSCLCQSNELSIPGIACTTNTHQQKKIERCLHLCEPVWPSGMALDWKVERPQFESASALLSLQKLWSVDTVL